MEVVFLNVLSITYNRSFNNNKTYKHYINQQYNIRQSIVKD